MQKVTEAVWHDPPVAEDVAPLQTSSSRLRPGVAGGVYLTSHCDSPDILEWEDMAQLQIQPRMYQVPYKVLVHYLGDTRPYVNLSVNVLTAADDDDTPAGKQQEQGEQGTGLKQKEDEVEEKGGKEETEKISIAQSYLRNDQLYKISPHHLREVGCVALKPEDLDVEVEATFQQSSNQLEETLIPPG
ncbi:hypothetical protein O3P69_005957 [Scylla paramamosain]|uniref:Uncharacterized protein n=1 Tax=Scylla paramamosain TaxID=85552 RepID=A0AAW0U4C7_SCYPA